MGIAKGWGGGGEKMGVANQQAYSFYYTTWLRDRDLLHNTVPVVNKHVLYT